MTPGRTVALILGCALLLPGGGLLLGGAGLAAAVAIGRDDSGYVGGDVRGLQTPTVAITVSEPGAVGTDGGLDWVVDAAAADVRLTVTGIDADPVFVGIARVSDVRAYLAGVAHENVVGIVDGRVEYRTDAGNDDIAAPGTQTFWVAQSTGPGTQELDWRVDGGPWAVVVMNADGSPDVSVAATAGVESGPLLWTAFLLVIVGGVLTAGAVALILAAAARHRVTRPPAASIPAASSGRPVTVSGRLDPTLSRWWWLIKWFLAIPHWIVLAFLWPAFLVVTTVAGLCILVTGVYPRSLFAFNLAVLRYSWRVSFYAASGGIGTDRYPPFSLAAEPNYPATLDVVYPVRLSRGLVLVKWWLLAIPHYLILGLLLGGWWGWSASGGDDRGLLDGGLLGGGILGLLTLAAGVVLLVTGRYPQALFDLIVGFNRWVFRVVAYAALMTDTYPPFRLDQGGSEPGPPPMPPQPPWAGPSARMAPEPVGSGVPG